MKKQEALEILGRNKASLREFHVSSLSLFGSVARDDIIQEAIRAA